MRNLEVLEGKKIPAVSIGCVTFNHENYIAQAIESFLIQETSFPVEILIYDDASTDTTPEIIREYESAYPDVIMPIYQTENQFSKKQVRGINLRFNFSRARGKYMAMCEGDDYWTESLKLQKQVDFLEANPEYVLCQHKTEMIWEDDSCPPKLQFCDRDELITQDILKRNLFSDSLGPVPRTHTSSSVFRMSLFRNGFPSRYEEIFAADRYMYLWASLQGKIKVLPDVMSVYRQHDGGISKGGGADPFLFACDHETRDFNIYRAVLPNEFHEELDMILDGIAKNKDMYGLRLKKCVEIWEKISMKYFRIALFGAGQHTNMLLSQIQKYGLKMPTIIFDSYPKGSQIFGVPVRHAQTMHEHEIDLVALSTLQFQQEMSTQIIHQLGKVPILDFYSVDPLNNL